MVKITEPMTMITDYILGLYSLWLSILILLSVDFSTQISSFIFSVAFIMTSLSAFVGGTSHGFKLHLSEKIDTTIWKITVYTIGLASWFMITGTTLSTVDIPWFRQLIYIIATIKLVIYMYWMYNHDEFVFVIIDYIPSMVFVIILKLVWYDTSSLWIIGGIILSFVAAGVQVSGFAIHKHLNHNDIFHIIQLPALYLLYRGVLLFHDI